jgi:hypothetical protein
MIRYGFPVLDPLDVPPLLEVPLPEELLLEPPPDVELDPEDGELLLEPEDGELLEPELVLEPPGLLDAPCEAESVLLPPLALFDELVLLLEPDEPDAESPVEAALLLSVELVDPEFPLTELPWELSPEEALPLELGCELELFPAPPELLLVCA